MWGSILLTSLCLAEGKLEWEMKVKCQTVCLGMGLVMDFKIILPVPILSSKYFGFPKACRYSPMTQPGKTKWTLCGTYINNNYASFWQILRYLYEYYDRCLTTWSHRRSLSNRFCCSLTSYCSACSAADSWTAFGWWAWGSLFWWKKHNYTDNYLKKAKPRMDSSATLTTTVLQQFPILMPRLHSSAFFLNKKYVST